MKNEIIKKTLEMYAIVSFNIQILNVVQQILIISRTLKSCILWW